MCQIISLSGRPSQIIAELTENYAKLKKSLDFKGGEGYSITFYANTDKVFRMVYYFNDNFKDNLFEAIEDLYKEKSEFFDYKYASCILFSRQRPEMEKENVQIAPYWNNDKIVWLHGTVSNIEELEKKYNVKVNVDSEIFLYANISEIKGIFTVAIAEDGVPGPNFYDKGLGYYHFNKNDVLYMTTDPYLKNRIFRIFSVNPRNENLIVSYSGGMDVTLSIYKAVLDNIKMGSPYENIYLCYFDYGARAREQEIQTLEKMKNKLKEVYEKLNIDVNVETKVFDVRGMMQNISMIYNQDIKLIDDNAQADTREAESTLAYIPFRNTFFIELLATFAEGKELENVDFLTGLNLSEGMIYLDNSEIWMNKIEKLIRRAGKDYHYNWQVIAPYYNKTKINMLKEFKEKFGDKTLEELLNISFSCYYPKENGEPCGECGSCLLRQKALESLKN